MFGSKGEGPDRTGLLAGEVDHLSGWDCDLDTLADGLHVDLAESERHVVPSDLDDWFPGPHLAVVLSSLDYSRLCGDDVLTVMKAYARLEAHMSSRRCAGIAETAICLDPTTTDRADWPLEFAAEEVGAALTLTRRKAQDDLNLAEALRRRLPQVGAALGRGEIDLAKTRLLIGDTAHLEPPVATRVVDEILPECPRLTTGQIRARLRKLCVEADPDDARERYELSLSERRVVAEPNPEGTAALIISQCAPEDVLAARDHIDTLAKRLLGDDETRSIDQLRADVAMGLLTGRMRGAATGSGGVVVTVPLTTLAELDRQSGDLAGYGPVHAELARKIVREQVKCEWTGVVTDPETGEALYSVALRRRPTAAQRRMIRALLPQCVFPGCRMPAIGSDLDHTVDYAARGPTTVCNQAPLCRRHHRAKHRGGWRYRRVDRVSVRWTSPVGRRYLVRARSP